MMTKAGTKHEMALRRAIVRAGRLLYRAGLIAGGDGNLSARLDDQRILITPASLPKGRLDPEDLVVIDHDGNLLMAHPPRRPSSEHRLHLQAYRSRSDVSAVVHAHPPTAVAATLAGLDLTQPLLPEAILALGPLPTAPYALTGTWDLAATIAELIVHHDAILLSHHGALTVGTSVDQALMAMEQVEHCAKILLAAHLFGGAQPLPSAQRDQLFALREQIRRSSV